MKPKKLVLSDWRQHASLEVTFADGMNVIRGPNGSGKTNILEALAMVNSMDTNSTGKKTDSIRVGSDRGSLYYEFEHDQKIGHISVQLRRNYRVMWEEQQLEVERAIAAVAANQLDPTQPVTQAQLKLVNFKPSESTKFALKWGDVECRNATEITHWFREHVRIDPKSILANYFPKQGDVDGAMSSDREERNRIFSQKAGTALCEKIWEELGAEQRSMPDLSGAEQQKQEAQTTLATTTAELSAAEQRLTTVQAQKQDTTQSSEVVRRYMAVTGAQKELQDLQQAVQSWQTTVVERQAVCDEQVVRGKALSAEIATLEPTISGLQKEQWELQNNLQLVNTRQQLTDNIQRLTQQLAAHPAPTPVADIEQQELDNVVAELAQLSARVKQLDSWLATFQTGKCPTCGQPVDSQAQAQFAAERQAANPAPLLTKKQQLEVARQQASAYRTAAAQYEQQRATLNAQLAAAQEQLAKIPENLNVSPERQQEIANLLTAFQQKTAARDQLRKQYDASYDQLTQATAQLQTHHTRLETVKQGVAGGVCPTPEEFKAAGDLIQEQQFVAQQLQEAQVAAQVAARRLEDAKVALKKAEASLAQMANQALWLSMVQRARELVHRNNLPQQVIAWYAQQLVEQTQTYLSLFDVDFHLEITSDLGLLGVFPDKVVPASVLSGGEANITNISMRLAMADLFPSELHLLVLDEVEVHLDQKRVARLPAVMERVKGLARNRGLVVLFISHHPALDGIADHAISVAA